MSIGNAEETGPHLTKRSRRKEERREAFIDAALQVFSEKGFSPTKMEDVSEAAGTSKGTLYLYFDSKEHLFEEMVRAKLLPLFAEAEESTRRMRGGSAAEALRAMIRFFYSRMLNSDRRQIMRLIMAEGPNFPHLSAFYYREILSRGQAVFRAILDYGQSTGEFREMRAHGSLQVLIGPAIAAGLWKSVFDSYEPLDLEAYCETHIDALLSTLRP